MQHHYSYRLSQRTIRNVCFVGFPVVALCAYAMLAGWGFSMAGGVRLEPGPARFFYTGFLLVGLTILGWGAWMLKIGLRTIVIDPEGITLPVSLMSKDMIRVPYGQIEGLESTEYNGIEVLHITHSQGKSRLESPHFESLDSFLELADRVHDALESGASLPGGRLIPREDGA